MKSCIRRCHYITIKLQLNNKSVIQSHSSSVCGGSDCPTLRTILCRGKGIGQRHASFGRDVIKIGGSMSSISAPLGRKGRGMSISRCAVGTNITTESTTYFNVFLNIVLVSNVNNRCIQLFRFNTKTALKSVK